MDKYSKKPERSKDHSANVSAADQAKQIEAIQKYEVFEDGGKKPVSYFVDPVVLRVARVTAGMAESNGSLPPGL